MPIQAHLSECVLGGASVRVMKHSTAQPLRCFRSLLLAEVDSGYESAVP